MSSGPLKQSKHQRLNREKRFDMIFLDPPYDTNLLAVALESIAKHGLLADDGCIICRSLIL